MEVTVARGTRGLVRRLQKATGPLLLVFGFLIPVAQIPVAAVVAVWLRGNVVAAVGSTLITNPFTFAPIYLLAYRLGSAIIGQGDVPAVKGRSPQREGLVKVRLSRATATRGRRGGYRPGASTTESGKSTSTRVPTPSWPSC